MRHYIKGVREGLKMVFEFMGFFSVAIVPFAVALLLVTLAMVGVGVVMDSIWWRMTL